MIVYPLEGGAEEFTIPGLFSALRDLIRSTEQMFITPAEVSGTTRPENPTKEEDPH